MLRAPRAPRRPLPGAPTPQALDTGHLLPVALPTGSLPPAPRSPGLAHSRCLGWPGVPRMRALLGDALPGALSSLAGQWPCLHSQASGPSGARTWFRPEHKSRTVTTYKGVTVGSASPFPHSARTAGWPPHSRTQLLFPQR